MEIRKLNTLRGIAAITVALSHYINHTKFLIMAMGIGTMGVMIFFILSGFLMSYLYFDKNPDKENIRFFATARIARVIPLFAIVVLVSYYMLLFGLDGYFYNVQGVGGLISHLALLSGDNVLWTIAPEIQFYALFILMWWLPVKRGKLYIFLIALILFLTFMNFRPLKFHVWGLFVDFKLIMSLPYFLVGTLMGELYKNWKPQKNLQSGFYIFALLIILFLCPRIFNLFTGGTHKMWYDIRVLLAMSFLFFSILFLVPDKNKILSNPVGDFLGKISYSFYLLNKPVLLLFLKYTPAKQYPASFLLLFIGSSLAISYLSYLTIEKPSRTAIRSFATKKPTKEARAWVQT